MHYALLCLFTLELEEHHATTEENYDLNVGAP